MTPLRIVRQADAKGCGVACVAMVTGRSYASVRRKALETGTWRERHGMTGGQLARLLAAYGRQLQATTMGRPVPRCMAIVKVRRWVPAESGARLHLHWVVYHAGIVFDPADGSVHAGMGHYLALCPRGRTGRWHWI